MVRWMAMRLIWCFHAFKKGNADILVATTIVENGIDIPNANTIIIDSADQFGVSDLYQLRGRIGRWNRRAYAYLLIPKRRSLSEIAKKRLDAIAQAGGYGGGIRIAMRDLEMRGAGDILGLEAIRSRLPSGLSPVLQNAQTHDRLSSRQSSQLYHGDQS